MNATSKYWSNDVSVIKQNIFRKLRWRYGKGEGLIAVADGEAAGCAPQGGDGGGGGVAGRRRRRCHPVQEELALPSYLLLCTGQFRRTKDQI